MFNDMSEEDIIQAIVNYYSDFDKRVRKLQLERKQRFYGEGFNNADRIAYEKKLCKIQQQYRESLLRNFEIKKKGKK